MTSRSPAVLLLQAALLLQATLCCTACSRSSSVAQPATPASAAVADSDTAPAPTSGVDTHSSQPDRASLPVVVAFGDSLTAGYGLDTGQGYPDFLERDLDRDGYRVRIVNLGVSGNTTKDGLARVQDALRLHPALVIAGFGGNDGLRGIPAADMQQNLSQILAAFQRAHVPVVLGGITLPPNYGAAYVQQFQAVFVALAKQYHVPLLPLMLPDNWNEPGMMQADGIHPSARGAQALAAKFVPLVEPLLKK